MFSMKQQALIQCTFSLPTPSLLLTPGWHVCAISHHPELRSNHCILLRFNHHILMAHPLSIPDQAERMQGLRPRPQAKFGAMTASL